MNWLVATALLLVGIIIAPPGFADTAAGIEHVSHGRFTNVGIYPAQGNTTSFALLLSGDGERNPVTATLAHQLAAQGAMVAVIDVSSLAANFDADPAQCVFPDGDLENLSHFLQAYYHLPTYLVPMLVGFRAGAGLGYAALVQAPGNTFAGAVTVGFCPVLSMSKPLCKGSGIEYVHRADGAPTAAVLPSRTLQNPWVALQSESDRSCSGEDPPEFVGKTPGAALVPLPHAGADFAATGAWLPQFLAAYDTLVKRTAAELVPPPPAGLANLPIIEIPAQPQPVAQPANAAQPASAAQLASAAGDTFAIILSGDGGWAGLDKEVAQALSVAGIPVVGLDSLRYFWTPRTPEGLAADTDRMIRYYLAHLHKQRVLLIGYSQGADVLPFAVSRLPVATRARVALTVLMGMSEHALFEFHVSSWISSSTSGPATLPEVDRISGTPVLCIYGEDDNDTLCPKLDPQRMHIVKLKGGHHFNGDYAGLAREILAAAAR